nr:hypothetical protein [Methylomarinum sp. Ch1-1]MDP4521212.1 hypothetical protein [Methylomarinum sp. Ch1-1]
MRVTPNSLIVGNSRPEMGLAPQSSCWKSEHGTVYSLTFPGLSAYEQIRALFHGVSSSNVSHILLGVDFYDVLYRRRNNDNPFAWPHKSSEFLDRLLVDENLKENDRFWRTQLSDSFMALFSLNAVIDSLYTIALQSPNSPDRTRLGFNPARDYQEVIQHEGAWVLFNQKLSELKSHFSKTGMSIYTPPYRWSIELEALKRTIKLVQKHNIHLIIFINPYHYSYLESIREAGYWDGIQA